MSIGATSEISAGLGLEPQQVVRAHHRKARIDDSAFTFVDLVDSGFHIIVDATSGYPAQRGEGTGVGIEWPWP